MQSTSAAATGPQPIAIRSAFTTRLLFLFVFLALASVAISLGGKWAGRTIALAGHSETREIHRILLGDYAIEAPANAIRFDNARRAGIATRADLYLHWPSMEGYSAERRDAFNNVTTVRSVLFLSFEEQSMSRDMTGRFRPIYSSLIGSEPLERVGDVGVYAFKPNTGYMDESLAVADLASGRPFVARCLTGEAARNSLAPCERDVLLQEGLSLTYRFPRHLLADWKALDAAVVAKARSMVVERQVR